MSTVNGISPTPSSSTTGTAKVNDNASLGKDDFLKLLVAADAKSRSHESNG